MTKADYGLAVAAWNLDATERRGLAHFKLLTLRALRFASLGLAAALTERASGVSTATAATGGTAAGTPWTTSAWATARATCSGSTTGTLKTTRT